MPLQKNTNRQRNKNASTQTDCSLIVKPFKTDAQKNEEINELWQKHLPIGDKQLRSTIISQIQHEKIQRRQKELKNIQTGKVDQIASWMERCLSDFSTTQNARFEKTWSNILHEKDKKMEKLFREKQRRLRKIQKRESPWKNDYFHRDCRQIVPCRTLCPRFTKWTENNLQDFYENLRQIRIREENL